MNEHKRVLSCRFNVWIDVPFDADGEPYYQPKSLERDALRIISRAVKQFDGLLTVDGELMDSEVVDAKARP